MVQQAVIFIRELLGFFRSSNRTNEINETGPITASYIVLVGF